MEVTCVCGAGRPTTNNKNNNKIQKGTQQTVQSGVAHFLLLSCSIQAFYLFIFLFATYHLCTKLQRKSSFFCNFSLTNFHFLKKFFFVLLLYVFVFFSFVYNYKTPQRCHSSKPQAFCRTPHDFTCLAEKKIFSKGYLKNGNSISAAATGTPEQMQVNFPSIRKKHT